MGRKRVLEGKLDPGKAQPSMERMGKGKPDLGKAHQRKEQMWNGKLDPGKADHLMVMITPAEDTPEQLRAVLLKDGALVEDILMPQDQVGAFFQKLTQKAQKLVVSYETNLGTTGGRRTQPGSGPKGKDAREIAHT